ncbi:MAG TPA: bifunctional phosphoribosyl-AMP cyclohydrolase/phosphoribosyl-ATP diphosphatase HisIE [Thermoanaerobaculia bacterium]|nr:bifunctional phosphoribosyl-AMP cyclohydrolase/phosphoribosyl-ATP diphosphatase HisIE [Thermoanaerobaculia bacterium]
MTAALNLDQVRFGPDGLVPVIVQEVESGAVRMLAWANREALERTVATGQVWFWSRSRQSLWRKGETSGNGLDLVDLRVDCDGDALLARVCAHGPTCHTGARTCFENPPGDRDPARLELGWLSAVIAARRGAGAETSYTARLLEEGIERIAQKVGEEGVEAALAGVLLGANPGDPDRRKRLTEESADLLYHLLVLLEACGVDPAEVAAELGRRHAGK